jgi:glyoxylase I family protein
MSREALDHVDLVVTSIERSLHFYERLLHPLGFGGTAEIVGEQGERVIYLKRPGSLAVGLRERRSEDGPAKADRYAIGLHHLAFAAPDREVIDEVAKAAAELGAETEGDPREFDYMPGYYAVFVHDPDGIKLEIVHIPGEG